MATRSSIAIQNSNGSITGIYCHWDGYLSHNGKMLVDHYNTFEKASELIALGDLPFLDKSTEQPERHSFENKINGYSVFYGRDREEDFSSVAPQTFKNYRSFLLACKQEYNYLFKNDKWHVNGKPLTRKMIEEDE